MASNADAEWGGVGFADGLRLSDGQLRGQRLVDVEFSVAMVLANSAGARNRIDVLDVARLF